MVRDLAARNGVQHADCLAAGKAAGELRGAVDRRRHGGARVAVIGELRRPTDAPRVEQTLTRSAVVHGAAIHVEPKDPRALNEEWPPFLEECLEDAEVQHCWIRFDLPEIGVDRGIEREVRREPVLQVGAAGHLL